MCSAILKSFCLSSSPWKGETAQTDSALDSSCKWNWATWPIFRRKPITTDGIEKGQDYPEAGGGGGGWWGGFLLNSIHHLTPKCTLDQPLLQSLPDREPILPASLSLRFFFAVFTSDSARAREVGRGTSCLLCSSLRALNSSLFAYGNMSKSW